MFIVDDLRCLGFIVCCLGFIVYDLWFYVWCCSLLMGWFIVYDSWFAVWGLIYGSLCRVTGWFRRARSHSRLVLQGLTVYWCFWFWILVWGGFIFVSSLSDCLLLLIVSCFCSFSLIGVRGIGFRSWGSGLRIWRVVGISDLGVSKRVWGLSVKGVELGGCGLGCRVYR